MSETTQYRESDLPLVDLRLEGGQGGEQDLLKTRSQLLVRLGTVGTLIAALSLSQSNQANANEPSHAIQTSPEVQASGSGSSQIDKHCDEVEGQQRFEGWIKAGKLEKHNYKRKIYAKVHEGKMYLCFSVPADEGKPYEHWTARYVGSENWFNDGRKVTSRDLNHCPTVNPCEKTNKLTK